MGVRSDWSELSPWARVFLVFPLGYLALVSLADFENGTILTISIGGWGYLIVGLVIGIMPVGAVFTKRLLGVGWVALASYGGLTVFLEQANKLGELASHQLLEK